MKRFIGARAAANVILTLLGALAVFHILVALRVVPAGMVWGGRSSSPAVNLVALEIVGLAVTLLFALIVAAKVGYLRLPRLKGTIGIATWVVFACFVLNTIGNLASNCLFEKSVFAPVTVVLSVLVLRLAVER